MAVLAVRFGPLAITRPQRGMPSAALNILPRNVDLNLVNVKEVDTQDGISRIHWRLVTSHFVTFMATARKMIDHYRKR
jgi:hypothetical protein